MDEYINIVLCAKPLIMQRIPLNQPNMPVLYVFEPCKGLTTFFVPEYAIYHCTDEDLE